VGSMVVAREGVRLATAVEALLLNGPCTSLVPGFNDPAEVSCDKVTP